MCNAGVVGQTIWCRHQGEQNLETGMRRGDIEEKGDGFYYFKRVVATDEITRSTLFDMSLIDLRCQCDIVEVYM
jgi:hypothetical protein